METMTMHISQYVSVAARLLFCFMLAAFVPPARSQTITAATPRLLMQGPAEQTGTPVLRDALGRPCLDVEAASRAHIVNRDMVDHVVSLKNNCLRLIRAKICYFNSEHCKDVVLQAYKRADVTLGTMRSITTFRYSITQK